MSQQYSNKWFKRKWNAEYIFIVDGNNFNNMKGHAYTFFGRRVLIDKGWRTDIDCLCDLFKEVSNETTEILELLYE